MKKHYVAGLLMALTFIPAVGMADVVEKYGTDSPLATDSQKRIFSKLFDIELWSDSYPEAYDQDLTIRIIFATRVGKSNAVDFIVEEAQEIHGFSNSQMDALADALSNSVMCEPKADSIIDFNYIPTKGIEVTCNGVTSNVPVADGPYSSFLLDVFLHEKSEFTKLASSS